MNLFAVVNHKGEAIVISRTMRGAKNYATRNKYTKVCEVSRFSWACFNVFEKVGKNWVMLE